MSHPLTVVSEIWDRAKSVGTAQHRNAVCLSTIDASGFPSVRFVDLKAVDETGLTFCTHLESGKAQDLARNPAAGMAMWWEHVATQIRISGNCEPITDTLADRYWSERPREARIVSRAFVPGRELDDANELAARYDTASSRMGTDVARPDNWGGFLLRPKHIEILAFRSSRLHVRTVYSRHGTSWHSRLVEP